MKLEDFKNSWKDLGENIENTWQLDLNLLRQSYLDKTSDKLNHLFRVKLLLLVFFLAITTYLIMVMFKMSSATTIATQASFVFWTIVVSLVLSYEILLLKRVDYNEPLAILLKKLSQIKLSSIRLLRLGALVLPFNTLQLVYYVITGKNFIGQIVIYGIDWVTLIYLMSCVLLSGLLIIKISLKNANKPWMYKLLNVNGSQVLDAIYFMNQIHSLEEDDSRIQRKADNK